MPPQATHGPPRCMHPLRQALIAHVCKHSPPTDYPILCIQGTLYFPTISGACVYYTWAWTACASSGGCSKSCTSQQGSFMRASAAQMAPATTVGRRPTSAARLVAGHGGPAAAAGELLARPSFGTC